MPSGGPLRISPGASPTYSWTVSASSASPLRVVHLMAALDPLEVAAAPFRQGCAVRTGGGRG
jgi:hypothetical protein